MGTIGTLLFAVVVFFAFVISLIVILFVVVGAKKLAGGNNGLTSDELKMLKEQFSKKAHAEKEAALAAKLKEIAPK